MVLATKCWFKVDYCFTIMSYDNLVHSLINKVEYCFTIMSYDNLVHSLIKKVARI